MDKINTPYYTDTCISSQEHIIANIMKTSFYEYYHDKNNKKLIIITEDVNHLKDEGHLFNDKDTIVIMTYPCLLEEWQLKEYNFRNANHYYLANDLEEYSLLKKHTENVVLCHQNSIYINEKYFVPGNGKKDSKGILISRKIPEKRIYLAELIQSDVLWICGKSWRTKNNEDNIEYSFNQCLEDVRPNIVLESIQRSKVGIILSDKEGGCFAVGEYLSCGIPVLTTPSYGGRDHYLSGMNSRYCEPNKEDVKKRFDLMQTIEWDANIIRDSYLKIVKKDQESFINLTHKIFKENNIEIDAREYFTKLLNSQETAKRFYSYVDIQTKYPNPKIPEKSEKEIDSSIWGITTFFNPAGYKNKYKNYRSFRASSKKQGLNLLTVELSFGDKPFELNKNDAEILIQIRGGMENMMWQKEALLNIGLKHLPKDCSKVIWVDCDIIFENENWVNDTSKLLDKYNAIQAFSSATFLEKNKRPEDYFGNVPIGLENGMRMESTASCVTKLGSNILEKPGSHGHPGFVWAMRKKILDKYGFYDKSIIGGGDLLMVGAIYSNPKLDVLLELAKTKEYLEWFKKVSGEVSSSVSFCPGNVFHLWHGKISDRIYTERTKILSKYNFDPAIDIKKNKDGIWQWSSQKDEMHVFLKNYFHIRKENNSLIQETADKIRLFISEIIKWINKNRGFDFYQMETPPSSDKYLIVKGVHGLGNRIAYLLSAIVYARLTKRQLVVDWSDGMYAEKGTNAFPELFQNPNIITNIKVSMDATIFPEIWRGNIDKSAMDMMKEMGDFSENPRLLRQKLSAGLGKFNYREKYIIGIDYYFKFDSLCKHLEDNKIFGIDNKRKSIKRLIDKNLVLNSTLKDEIDSFVKDNFTSNTIGVHIRYTDNMYEKLHWMGLSVSLERYLLIIDNILKSHPKTMIFLATDNKEILDLFEKRYPKVVSIRKYYNPSPGEPIHFSKEKLNKTEMAKHALMDAYLLAKCNCLVYSGKSTFGELAVALSSTSHRKIYNIDSFFPSLYHPRNTILFSRCGEKRAHKKLYNFLGRSGKKIKEHLPKVYFFLKNFFPDK